MKPKATLRSLLLVASSVLVAVPASQLRHLLDLAQETHFSHDPNL